MLPFWVVQCWVPSDNFVQKHEPHDEPLSTSILGPAQHCASIS